MKLSASARADAKKYNAEYDLFEGYDHETGESTYYRSYGVAYRYTSARVRRGANMSIIGIKYVGEDYNGLGLYQHDELICC